MAAQTPKRPPPLPDASRPLGTFGDLLAERGIARDASPPAAAPEPAHPPPRSPADGPDLSRCKKVVVRRERKGHGGKTATMVAGLGLPAADLERVARALRRGLGCGATVAGEQVLVQGDQTDRVRAWLAAHGVQRIVVGN